MSKISKRAWKIVVFTSLIVLVPVAALAAVGAFSSGTATPAVTGTNSSSTAGAKGVYGLVSANSSNQRSGVFGNAAGSGGVGVWGQGSKYGVFSNGPLGVASGKALVCSGCVSKADLNFSPEITGNVLSAVVASNGMLVRGTNVSSATVTVDGAGTYEVLFNRDISSCVAVGALGGVGNEVTNAGQITITGRGGNVDGLYIVTSDSSGTTASHAFHVIVIC